MSSKPVCPIPYLTALYRQAGCHKAECKSDVCVKFDLFVWYSLQILWMWLKACDNFMVDNVILVAAFSWELFIAYTTKVKLVSGFGTERE